MDLTEDGDQDKPKEVIRKKRKTGSRCIAYGCGNTLHKGFIMHLMPGKMPVGQEQFDNVQKQWITFIGKKRKFEAKDAITYSNIFVCSGHFVREDYEQSQVKMYRRGLRTRPPSLKKCSLPSLNTAEQPFPSDWFLTSPTSPSSLSSPSSSSPTGTCSTTTSTSCTVPTPALHEHLPPSSDSPSPLHTSHEPDIPKGSHRESIYIRKRDVGALYIDYGMSDMRMKNEPKTFLIAQKEYSVQLELSNRNRKMTLTFALKSVHVGREQIVSMDKNAVHRSDPNHLKTSVRPC